MALRRDSLYSVEFLLLVIIFPISTATTRGSGTYLADCEKDLRPGQYLCNELNIDRDTQQPVGCAPDNLAPVDCTAVDGIICSETGNGTFQRKIPCEWTNGYSFETALILSVFFGMFGADRFYLGYPAIGLLKFCTLGFMFFGQLVDVVLIATQVKMTNIVVKM